MSKLNRRILVQVNRNTWIELPATVTKREIEQRKNRFTTKLEEKQFQFNPKVHSI